MTRHGSNRRKTSTRRRQARTGRAYTDVGGGRRPAPLNPLADTVALVPVGEIARRYLRHGVYIRRSHLHGQIRLCATHLGWSTDGAVQAVRPIVRHWRIGSAAAIPATGVTNARAVTSEWDVHENWPGPATLFELGEPITLDLPLGYALNPNGGAPAIRGVHHKLLNDLLTAARSGSTLIATPKV